MMLNGGRICREGQKGVPKAYIIADRLFKGDRTAFQIKESRDQEGKWMHCALKPRHVTRTFDQIARLRCDEKSWIALKQAEKEKKFQQRLEQFNRDKDKRATEVQAERERIKALKEQEKEKEPLNGIPKVAKFNLQPEPREEVDLSEPGDHPIDPVEVD